MTTTLSATVSDVHRFDWVDIAKGICIIAVVGLYARNELERAMGHAGWLDPWSVFAQPFRMPDFFLLSGLFLSAVINRPWRSYLDTKVVHYVYFLVLWVVILATYDVFYLGTRAPSGAGLMPLLKFYVWKLIYPDHMLWFLQILPAFFVVTRLLRRSPPALLCTAAALALVAHIKTGFAPVDNFLAYYVFFLAGHYGAPWLFTLADRAAAHRVATLVLFTMWCFVNQWAVGSGATSMPGGSLLFGCLGILAIISISSLLSPMRAMGWLRYAGSHSIVIYLGFFIPLTLFLEVLASRQFALDPNLLATMAVVVGGVTPLLVHWLFKGTVLRFLFVRPAWAHLVPARRRTLRAGATELPKP